jgi:hypothetical protein
MDYDSDDSESSYDFRTGTPAGFTTDGETGENQGNFLNTPRLRNAKTTTSRFGRRKQRRFENDFFFIATKCADTDARLATRNPTMVQLSHNMIPVFHDDQENGQKSNVFLQFKKQSPKQCENFFEGEQVETVKASSPGVSAQAPKQKRCEKRKKHGNARFRNEMLRVPGLVKRIEEAIVNPSAVQNEPDLAVVATRECDSVTIVSIKLQSPFHRMLAHGLAQLYGAKSWTDREKAVNFKLDAEFSKRYLQLPSCIRV